MLQIHYSPGTTELAAKDHRLLAAVRDRVAAAHPHGPTPTQLVLSDDDHLQRLNVQYRGKDAPTDVLSFDYRTQSPPAPGVAPIEGEVYISMDRARQQAADQGVALVVEVARLAVHGLLHLAGRDHDTPEKLHAMEIETDILLKQAGVGDVPHASIDAPQTALAGGVPRKE